MITYNSYFQVHIFYDKMLPLLQSFQDLLIEAVFPGCAICRLGDSFVQSNAKTLSRFVSGKAHRLMNVLELYAGSRAEGLALEDSWGHPNVDLDQMVFPRLLLSVSLPQSHGYGSDPSNESASSSLPNISSKLHSLFGCAGNSCLEYAPEDSPPAYTRLRVTDPQALRNHFLVGDHCMEQSGGQYWFLPARFNGVMQRIFNLLETDHDKCTTRVQGPAGQVGEGLMDRVPSLLANGPHPAIDDYIQRIRRRRADWPTPKQLVKVKKIPACLVMATHKKAPNRHQLTRMSWSIGELILISELPDVVKQGYIAAKYTLKSFLRHHKKPDDSRSNIGSFHLKNTLLNYLEQAPPSTISSPFALMMELLQKLLGHVRDGRLPLYFLPECNLLETVELAERQIAMQAILDIIENPMAAIINSPSKPWQIYGDLFPEQLLLKRMHYVLAHPNSDRSRETLFSLLSRLDEHRQQRYRKQLDLDEKNKVSGRPKLIKLVDMMSHIKYS